MEIRQVQSRADFRRFVNYLYQFYRDDPLWIAPLRSEQRAQFNPRKNAMLDHCDYALFLLEDKGQIIGRISAFIDHVATQYWGEEVGLFGAYECIDDPEASKLLLDTARDWLKARGMTAMRGPWSFMSQEWGAVIEGFEPEPVIMAPYNPPYFPAQFESYGLSKVMDLLVYYIDFLEGYDIPERYLNLTQALQERYGVRVRPVNPANWDAEVATILDLGNISIADNWGYSPVTDAEAEEVGKSLKQIIDTDAVMIAEDREGNPIGFSVPIPDINEILKGMNGRLLPFGWLKLLTGMKKIRTYRLWALGVVPEYQGKAVDALLYSATYEALKPRQVRIEINYVLETNAPMNNALHRLGVKPLRKYRVYEMPI